MMKNKTYLFSFIFLCSSQVSLAQGNLSLVADKSTIADNSINSIVDTQKPKIISAKNTSFEKNEASVESKTDLFTFKTEYLEKPSFDWRQNNLGINNNNSVWGASLQSALLNDSVKIHGELKSGKFRTYESRYLEDSNKFGQNPYSNSNNLIDNDNRLINLTLDGKSSFLNYGIKYQNIGLNYSSLIKATEKNIKKDSAGFNYWVGRDIDNLNLKLTYSDMWDNVKLDPTKPQYNEKLTGLSSTYAISSWPYSAITLAYKFGDRKTTYVPLKKQSYSGSVNQVSALFYLSYDNLDVSVGSTLENKKNAINAQDKTQSISYYLSASFSPISSVYITPNISYSTDFIENTYS